MSDAILVFNAGSSSIKFALFKTSDQGEPQLSCRGLLDEDQADPRLVVTDTSGHVLLERQSTQSDAVEGRLFGDVVDWVESQCKALAGIGHRVVHGGRKFVAPVRISQQVIAELDQLTPLAPLHQPRCLNPIRKINSLRPNIPQFACFDTAFHCVIEPPVSRFALPRRFEELGIRRYGFHGLSYEYIADRLAALSPALAASRTVVAHLGNGASLCAMRNGRSIDTTMGLTALDGIVMGTRCGALDPGVLLYLQQALHMSAADVERLLYRESGLLGVSGISHDVRTLLASDDPRAAEALDLLAFSVSRHVAAMTNSLGGLDRLVFTGGIGEHAGAVRAAICARLRWLGLELDSKANDLSKSRISAKESRIDVRVIATDEEIMIARHCLTAAHRRPCQAWGGL
ncbi:acetate/propionate family kinase [Bradyrhizobium archetypum]|uniref:Acetate kinase n=1 Tax=Bradyrhizobium archetypum TaxID=2721160 RepID=A0A7Y4H5W4_9BRAD|nr:acetate/propionate family kinase [Bradyrhizobium archetypum]NOJ48250.1 acetate/propionate family kinase [Bradyrhizobium archetypum]